MLAASFAALSYWPVRNMIGRGQLMNCSFNRLHLVSTYGAFGSVTRVRCEVVIEGTDAADPSDDASWLEYEFRGKPGDTRRRPPQVAPYHLRLDWPMWLAALSLPVAVHEQARAARDRRLLGPRADGRLPAADDAPRAAALTRGGRDETFRASP